MNKERKGKTIKHSIKREPKVEQILNGGVVIGVVKVETRDLIISGSELTPERLEIISEKQRQISQHKY